MGSQTTGPQFRLCLSLVATAPTGLLLALVSALGEVKAAKKANATTMLAKAKPRKANGEQRWFIEILPFLPSVPLAVFFWKRTFFNLLDMPSARGGILGLLGLLVAAVAHSLQTRRKAAAQAK